MNIILTFILTIAVIFIWSLRRPIASLIGIMIFYSVDPIYRSKANRYIKLTNKLEDDESIHTTLELYKHKFFMIKILGFIVLSAYSWASAWLVYIILPIWWMWLIVLIGAFVFNWNDFVASVSLKYLLFRQSRSEGIKLKEFWSAL